MSRALHCDKTRRAFENNAHFSSVLKCPECQYHSVLNTRLRLLYLLYDIVVMWRKTIKHAFSVFYTLIKHEFLTTQSARRVLCYKVKYSYNEGRSFPF